MVQRAKSRFLQRVEEEFIWTTDTLWENEVKANLFVARILLETALIDVVFIVGARFGVFDVSEANVTGILTQTLFLLVGSALLCFYFKGRKNWLKIVMMVVYTVSLIRVYSIMTYYVVLVFAFPIILSVRYYSKPFTIFIGLLTVAMSGMADYFAVVHKYAQVDMNFLQLDAGTSITFDKFDLLKNVVMQQANIDYDVVWQYNLLHSYMPRIVLYVMIALICMEIAMRGRMAIFEQQSETQKTERISTELNLASSIQANMLPNIFPAFPERTDFDVYATMDPAKEVGGDFYDFFMVDDDHLALVMADVSGKGIPAAMFMVIAKTLIKDHAQLGLSPGEVFTRVNNLLCEGNEAGLFVTAWMCIIDVNNGDVVYANAGHNPPVFVRNGKADFLDCKPGFVLAGLEDYEYREYLTHIEKGDKIFLYTDGATEATNLNKELYGEDRLITCIRNLPEGTTCVEAIHTVRLDIDNFVGEAEQFDDLTMLAFDFTEKKRIEQ